MPFFRLTTPDTPGISLTASVTRSLRFSQCIQNIDFAIVLLFDIVIQPLCFIHNGNKFRIQLRRVEAIVSH